MATSQKAVNQYRKKNYYTFSVSVPAQYRGTIKATAAARGGIGVPAGVRPVGEGAGAGPGSGRRLSRRETRRENGRKFLNNRFIWRIASVAYSQKAVNDFHRRRYYQIVANVPIEYKETIKATAAARGVSVSRLVCDLLGKELGWTWSWTGPFPAGKRGESS